MNANRQSTGRARADSRLAMSAFVMVVVAVAVAVATAGGCGGPAEHQVGFDLAAPPTNEPLLAVSSGGASDWRFSVWTSPNPPRKGVVDVLFRVTDALGSPVEGLTLQVVPWMPAHGHGGSRAAPVVAAGDGWYVVSPIYLYMSGRWELRTAVEGHADDGVVPMVDVP